MGEPEGGSAGLLQQVGMAVRDLRMQRGLSMVALCEAAGISRSMLASIEGGKANASLVTIDKLAAALGVDFADLVGARSGTPVQSVSAAQASVLWRAAGEGGLGRMFLSTRGVGRAEYWDWSLAPGQRYEAQPDAPGSEELLGVQQGTLTVCFDAERVQVPTGTVLRIPSDRHYSYLNEGAQDVRFVRIVVINSGR
ncbi:helix-turn-helix domain-containing protein [Glutamicibacter sp. X7]